MNCYRIISAMMHMGCMKFKQRPREEQAEPDGTDGLCHLQIAMRFFFQRPKRSATCSASISKSTSRRSHDLE